MKKQLYIQVNVWKTVSSTEVHIYRVFKRLSDEQYAVQSMDSIRLPLNGKDIQYQNSNLYELFMEMDIEERGDFHETIEKAIETFDADFS